MVRTNILNMYQFDFISDGVKISLCEGDRQREIHRVGDDLMVIDDGGGFVLNQEFLDEHQCFIEFPLYNGETLH